MVLKRAIGNHVAYIRSGVPSVCRRENRLQPLPSAGCPHGRKRSLTSPWVERPELREEAMTAFASEDGNEARVIRQAQAWVRDVVVKLRLCPFAEGVFKTTRGVRYVVSAAEDTEDLWTDFLSEVDVLMSHRREEVGTTLLMAPRCLQDLADFNDFCAWLEETIEDDEVLVDQVLVACFHPRHAFHGLDEDDVLNYEKRSPHPTINILRADVVDEHVAAGKTLGISEHNKKRLHAEGKASMKAAFDATLALE